MPLEPSAGTNVWPVERPVLILIQATISLGMNTPSNQDTRMGTIWTEKYQKERGISLLQAKAGKANNTVFQKLYFWWHWRGVVFPVCIHCASASSCPPCLQLWWRHWMIEQCWVLLLIPSCYSSSLCSNKCLVCHSSLLQRIRFILPLSHTPPPLSALLPPRSLLAVHLRSVTREETQREPRIQMGCLP